MLINLKKKSFFEITVFYLIIWFTLGGFYAFSFQKQSTLIIDADTANEIDDLFAIVRAIVEPEFELLAITSAHFNKSPLASSNSVMESQILNEKITFLMGKKNIFLPLGSNFPLSSPIKPMSSEASAFIIKSAHKMSNNEKLNIVILGPCTNVASAIIQDPSIIPNIRVYYLGIWHDKKLNTFDKNEFNTRNDKIALEVLLNSLNLDLHIMSASTSQHLQFERKIIEKKFKNKGGIAELLLSRWNSYKRWWTEKDPRKQKWTMWDLALIEAIASPSLAKQKNFITPKENIQRQVKIYTFIDDSKMEKKFWKSISNYY
jgi:purine nucleosidase